MNAASPRVPLPEHPSPWIATVLGASSHGISVGDASRPGFPLVYVNDGFVRLTGYAREELLGRSCSLLQVPETDGQALDEVRHGLAHGEEVRVTLVNGRRDGSRFWNQLALSPVRDAEGAVTHVVGLQLDVSAELDARREVDERDARYQLLLDTLGDAVVLYDEHGEAVVASRHAEEVLGLGAEDLRRDPEALARRLVRPDGSPVDRDDLPPWVVLRRGRSSDEAMLGLRTEDRGLRWLRVVAHPHPDQDGRPSAVVASFADVTEREELTRRHDALRHVATAVAAESDPSRVFALVGDQARFLTRAETAVIARFLAPTRLEVVGGSAPSPSPWHRGQGIELDGPELHRRLATEGAWRPHPGAPEVGPLVAGRPSAVVAPVRIGQRSWGCVAVATADRDGLGPRTEADLTEFADLVALAVTNDERRTRLAQQASSDPLTGAANHRSFQERLHTEWERARRHGRRLAVAALDIDHFKTINDQHGHGVGDQVLVAVVDCLRAGVREGDLVGRLGGDELALLATDSAADAAHLAVERVRDAVGELRLPGGLRVTVSAGVADSASAGSAAELVALADRALYWSKAHGRDRSSVYDPMVVRELTRAERGERQRRGQALVGLRELARAVDAAQPGLADHSERVAALAARLATRRGWDSTDVRRLREAALVHDVGKVGVDDALLRSVTALTETQMVEMRTHAGLSARIAAAGLDAQQTRWVREHHERPDGTGYPHGLRDDELSAGGALLAMAEAFVAMTTDRGYRPGREERAALAECRHLARRQFTAQALGALSAAVGSDD